MDRWRSGERWTGSSRLSERFRWREREGSSVWSAAQPPASQLPLWRPIRREVDGAGNTGRLPTGARTHTQKYTHQCWHWVHTIIKAHRHRHRHRHRHVHTHTHFNAGTDWKCTKGRVWDLAHFCHFLSLLSYTLDHHTTIVHHYWITKAVVPGNDNNSWFLDSWWNGIGSSWFPEDGS